MDGPSLFRTFLVFLLGGLALTTAAVSIFFVGGLVWHHCFLDSPNPSCADTLFYAGAFPLYGLVIALGLNFLPLVVGAVLAVLGRVFFRRVPLWYLLVILPGCVLAYVAQISSWYPQDVVRPLSERLPMYAVLQMPCLLICWWWDRRE